MERQDKLPQEYPFPTDLQARSYCCFPEQLESDAHVLFHGTAIANLKPILEEGFKIPDPDGIKGLPSVSFAKRSSAALTVVAQKREAAPGDYCILAVRYGTLERQGIKDNPSDIHDYTLDPSPEIIGYCVIPTSYRHI